MDEAPRTLETISSLEEYLETYQSLFAGKIQDDFTPLHTPGVDPVHPLLGVMLKGYYPAQQHFITALVRCLDHQSGVFGVGACGTGKTPMALGVAHCHARGRPYRAIVMAPDHLLGKWRRHVLGWVPDASATVFDSWRDWSRLADQWTAQPKDRRPKPTHPEWYIIGRDASKFDPSWVPKVERHARRVEVGASHATTVGFHCVECGALVADSEGRPLDLSKLAGTKQSCKAKVFPRGSEEARICGAPLWGFIGSADRRRVEAYREAQSIRKQIDEIRESRVSRTFSADDKDKMISELIRGFKRDHPPSLGVGFFQDGFLHGKSIPWRYAPARIIHKRLKGFFDYAFIDEAHEEKSAVAAQANAAGKIMASARKSVALTGTILGGYAWHIFPFMYRLAPANLRESGIEWGQEMTFSQRYGRIDEIIITKNKQGTSISNSSSMGKKEVVTRRKVPRPGIMPTLFGEQLISNTAFLGLEEISEALPPKPIDEIRPVEMDSDIREVYESIEEQIKAVIAPMLARGDTSLLGKMLRTLLDYTDHPWGWTEDGYLDPFGITKLPVFPEDRIYPKEQDLIDFCLEEKNSDRKVWVFVQMTNKRDIIDRIVKLLRKSGIKADSMRSDVDRSEREDWIINNAPGLDVMISHPKLVETGIDLFYFDPDSGYGHNFPSIYWYQTGYNLFTLRQASRRAWRIGQPEECRCAYTFYEGTMQARAMELIGKKLAAAEAVDGKFSAEGLAAMAGDESLELQLARSLADRIHDVRRQWSRITTAGTWTPKPRKHAPVPVPAANGHSDRPEVPPDLAALLRSVQAPVRARKVDPGQLLFDW